MENIILDDIHIYMRWAGHVELYKNPILNRYTQDERETETICTGLNLLTSINNGLYKALCYIIHLFGI